MARTPTAAALLLLAPLLPSQDAAPAPALVAAIRRLEPPDTRAAALAELERSSAAALPLVFLALRQEREAVLARPGFADVLADVYARLYAATHGGRAAGKTFVYESGRRRLVEFDQDGKVSWEMPVKTTLADVELTPRDTLLLTEVEPRRRPPGTPQPGPSGRVFEIDRAGAEKWSFAEVHAPRAARALVGGNVLIADTEAGRVIEVTPEHRIVLEYKDCPQPIACERTADGHTWILDGKDGKLIEIDERATALRRTDLRPRGAIEMRALGDGHFLLCQLNQVQEIDLAGNPTGPLFHPQTALSAQRLPGGFTLIAEGDALREYDRDNHLVGELPCANGLHVLRR